MFSQVPAQVPCSKVDLPSDRSSDPSDRDDRSRSPVHPRKILQWYLRNPLDNVHSVAHTQPRSVYDRPPHPTYSYNYDVVHDFSSDEVHILSILLPSVQTQSLRFFPPAISYLFPLIRFSAPLLSPVSDLPGMFQIPCENNSRSRMEQTVLLYRSLVSSRLFFLPEPPCPTLGRSGTISCRCPVFPQFFRYNILWGNDCHPVSRPSFSVFLLPPK